MEFHKLTAHSSVNAKMFVQVIYFSLIVHVSTNKVLTAHEKKTETKRQVFKICNYETNFNHYLTRCFNSL